MHNSIILLFHMTLCIVHCHTATLSKCSNYEPNNKENLRNCLSNRTTPELVTSVPTAESSLVENPHNRVKSDSFNNLLKPSALLRKLFLGVLNEKEWRFQLVDGFEVQVATKMNGSERLLNVSLNRKEISVRKTQTSMVNKILPYVIVPGFVMAGVLPWVIPGIRVVVGAATMINQMAFTSSLFSFLRGYIFDTEKEEHIVYINNGYKNKPLHYGNQHHR